MLGVLYMFVTVKKKHETWQYSMIYFCLDYLGIREYFIMINFMDENKSTLMESTQ